MNILAISALALTFLMTSQLSAQAKKKSEKAEAAAKKSEAPKKAEEAKAEDTKTEAPKSAAKSDKDEVEDLDTKFDFGETSLKGKMKAPPGLMLKGRVEQNKNQMVHLRQNFRPELNDSQAAVRAVKPKD